jgi:lipopolysaccharide/colanic/teichoic acid biosynthesis glycosyltransferase
MGFFKSNIAKLRQTELDGIALMSFDTTTTDEFSLFLKKAMDIAGALLAIAVLSPVFLIVAFMIKLTSKGPVFFVQRRVGLNGRNYPL